MNKEELSARREERKIQKSALEETLSKLEIDFEEGKIGEEFFYKRRTSLSVSVKALGKEIQGLENQLGKLTTVRPRKGGRAASVDRDVGKGLQEKGAEKDAKFMKLAIEEAKKSISKKDMTPLYVGVVIVKDGKILAKSHKGEISEGDHAEYTALERKLPDVNLSGATLYTTLEPCTTREHLPEVPCARRIVQRRISKVVIGVLDPNPDICGNGYWLLKENNVIVEYSPNELQEEIAKLNQEFIAKQLEIAKQGGKLQPDGSLKPEVLEKRPEMHQKIRVVGGRELTITQAWGDVVIIEKGAVVRGDVVTGKKVTKEGGVSIRGKEIEIHGDIAGRDIIKGVETFGSAKGKPSKETLKEYMDKEKAFLRSKLNIHLQNLRNLELQKAKYGSLNVPVHILSQIEEEKSQIAEIKRKLA